MSGVLVVLAVMAPIAAAALAPLLGARATRRLLLWWLLPGSLALAIAIAATVLRTDAALVVQLGGIAPPLGIAFRADGLSACFLLVSAVVMGGAVLALDPPEEDRRGRALHALLPALWGGANLAFVAQDLFSVFIALELLTFGAIPLVALDGSRATLEAALRYLLFALLGSVLVLLAVALLYGTSGALDLAMLRPTMLAAMLLTVGLLAKTALVPLHAWLPPAHAGAPAVVSAILSALVVKAGFVLLVRLWFGPLAVVMTPALATLLALLGAAAILLGGVLALRQQRLKMLVAYSTVAQLGYLFLVFPLVLAAGQGAWLGGMLQAVSHALAKAAMFVAAGSIAYALGHDRVAALAGAPRLALLAFALAGLSLMGIPPSGGFTAKWLLLGAAIGTGQWWWGLAVVGGGVLTGGYLFRVLTAALRGPAVAAPLRPQAVALGLALLSILLGLLPLYAFGLVEVGRP
jgi:multicomponent Na+:H+ antiporter subunit D